MLVRSHKKNKTSVVDFLDAVRQNRVCDFQITFLLFYLYLVFNM